MHGLRSADRSCAVSCLLLLYFGFRRCGFIQSPFGLCLRP
jgi:hypothetical protein